jgi:hypothetical protein
VARWGECAGGLLAVRAGDRLDEDCGSAEGDLTECAVSSERVVQSARWGLVLVLLSVHVGLLPPWTAAPDRVRGAGL